MTLHCCLLVQAAVSKLGYCKDTQNIRFHWKADLSYQSEMRCLGQSGYCSKEHIAR